MLEVCDCCGVVVLSFEPGVFPLWQCITLIFQYFKMLRELGPQEWSVNALVFLCVHATTVVFVV